MNVAIPRWFCNLNRGARALSGGVAGLNGTFTLLYDSAPIVSRHCLTLHQRFKMKGLVDEPISIL